MDSTSTELIKRGTVVSLPLSKKGNAPLCDYVVLGVFNKYYNKWFLPMEEQVESATWKLLMKTSEYWLHLRMVMFDSVSGNHQLAEIGDDSNTPDAMIYRMVPQHGI